MRGPWRKQLASSRSRHWSNPSWWPVRCPFSPPRRIRFQAHPVYRMPEMNTPVACGLQRIRTNGSHPAQPLLWLCRLFFLTSPALLTVEVSDPESGEFFEFSLLWSYALKFTTLWTTATVVRLMPQPQSDVEYLDTYSEAVPEFIADLKNELLLSVLLRLRLSILLVLGFAPPSISVSAVRFGSHVAPLPSRGQWLLNDLLSFDAWNEVIV